MNVNLKRLGCICAVVVLVVSVAGPAAAKKPQPEEPPPDFRIETHITNYHSGWVGWYDQRGSFVASGMINDEGAAAEDYPYGDVIFMTLSGDGGEIDIMIQLPRRTKKQTDGTTLTGQFEVVGGTGAYAGLQASGSASCVSQRWWGLDFFGVPWTEVLNQWQLDGFVTSW